TLTDFCEGGTCKGVDPVDCSVQGGPCQIAGPCVPATGKCPISLRPDGTACQTGIPCWVGYCLTGICQVHPLPGCTSSSRRSSCSTSSSSSGAMSSPPWSSAGAMSTSRAGHSATLLGSGDVLVAGGYGGGAVVVLASVELYHPAANTWS